MKALKSHWVWLLPLFAFVPVLMAPSGGYPSNPTFQNVSVAAGTGNPSIITQFFISGGTPETFYINAGAAADTKVWDMYEDSGGTLHARTLNDALGSAQNWLDISRTGINVGTLTLCGGCSAGGGIVTIPAKLTLTGNAQQPLVAFDASLLVGPSINNCLHCQATPTIVRNSIGNYTITAQSSGTYIWSCTFRNNSAAPGTVSINSTGTGAVTLLIFSTGGSLADPSPNTIQCVGVS